MPAPTAHRQPEPPAWFGTPDGAALLAAESARIAALLAVRTTAPVLWLCPAAPGQGQAPGAAVLLHAQGPGRLGGSMDCRPGALPLADASLSTVIIQHLADTGQPELLAECARVLHPGGSLWLLVLNPYSPCRLRWRRNGLQPRRATQWQRQLRQAGLECVGRPEYLGPVRHGGGGWPTPLRAAILLRADRRGPDRLTLPVLRRAWSPAAAPGALAGGLARGPARDTPSSLES